MTGKRHCPAPVSERAGNGKAGAGGLRRQKRQSSSRNGQSADFSALPHQVRAAARPGWPAGRCGGSAGSSGSPRLRRGAGAGTTGGLACALAWPGARLQPERSVSPGGRNNRSPFRKPSPCRCAVPFSPSFSRPWAVLW
ncbi:hypothetical protein CSC46_2400 [Pseudomonas aeruginosa]|nr:hypothetical protein CSC46_2400 [Pseudomonas aeruginosa]